MVGSQTHHSQTQAHGQVSTQQGLADSLVECMGRESAIHVCQVNGWQGVLKLLLDQPDCGASRPI